MGPILSKTGTLKTTKETDKNKTMKKKKKRNIVGSRRLVQINMQSGNAWTQSHQ